MNLAFPLFPESASTAATRVDALFYFLLTVCGLVTLLIACLILYFCVRYRRRSEDEIPPPVSTNYMLEATWIGIPLVIFMVIFFWGAYVYFYAFSRSDEALDVYVVGKQWMWKFQHPGGQREINQLHIPTGRVIKLTMASQDVIHSFFVPDFRIHRDVLPNRYTTVWFEATKPGSYHLFCSQYCGAQHSGMVGEAIVMKPSDYEAWLSGGGEGALASKGEKLFAQLACNTCHTGDARAHAPLLEGLFNSPTLLRSGETVTADENYLRESILNPQAKVVAGYQPIMPTFQGQIDEEQLFQLIAYIKSLSAGRRQLPPVSSPTGPQPSPVGGALPSQSATSPPNATPTPAENRGQKP